MTVIQCMIRFAGLVAVVFVLNASAQSHAIAWFTIDGGGASSTGVAYSVTGTIGQPDAGRMSGGDFSVDGGFWPVVLPEPERPLLRTRLSGGGVIVSWPASAAAYRLEQCSTFDPGNWSNVPTPPEILGDEKFVIIPAADARQFYRLVKP